MNAKTIKHDSFFSFSDWADDIDNHIRESISDYNSIPYAMFALCEFSAWNMAKRWNVVIGSGESRKHTDKQYGMITLPDETGEHKRRFARFNYRLIDAEDIRDTMISELCESFAASENRHVTWSNMIRRAARETCNKLRQEVCRTLFGGSPVRRDTDAEQYPDRVAMMRETLEYLSTFPVWDTIGDSVSLAQAYKDELSRKHLAYHAGRFHQTTQAYRARKRADARKAFAFRMSIPR